MSFDPKRDGKKIWPYLHVMGINATTQYKRDFYVWWLNSLKEAFPCEVCRVHLNGNLETLPVEPYNGSHHNLFRHGWILHDTVNGQLHKPKEQCLNHSEAWDLYSSLSEHELGSIFWTYMHLMAANATTPRKRELYMMWLNGMKEALFCESWRPLFVQVLDELPVEPYRNTNISLFRHSWKVHDVMNDLFKKAPHQKLNYDQAFALFFPGQDAPGAGHPPQPEQQIAYRQPRQIIENIGSGSAQTQVGNARPEEGYVRHMASSSNQTGKCSSCGRQTVESEKRDYQEFRDQRRKTYLPKPQ